MRLVAFLFAVMCSSGAIAGGPSCRLASADKAANAKLSFDDFDQKGVTGVTWRKLEERGCHALAAEADEDYLVNGPMLIPDQKQDVMFHEAQSLAMMDRNVEAAHMVAAAIPPDRSGHGDLDWTTYLTGTPGHFSRKTSRFSMRRQRR